MAKENANLAIWNALGKTAPSQTKPFDRPGFKGTAIKPVYTNEKMTELFGPCGTGWGFSEPQFQLVNGTDGQVAVYCWLTLWYAQGGKRSEPIPGVGGDVVVKKFKDGRMSLDDEAFKKATTDAIGNAMMHLGMSADVYGGMFEDSKYVASRRQEEAEERDAEQEPHRDPAPRDRRPAPPPPERTADSVSSRAAAPHNGNGNGRQPAQRPTPFDDETVAPSKQANGMAKTLAECKSLNDLDALKRTQEFKDFWHHANDVDRHRVSEVANRLKAQYASDLIGA